MTARPSTNQSLPIRLLMLLVGVPVVTGVAALCLVHFLLPTLSRSDEILLSTSIFSLILCPALYIFVYGPLLNEVKERQCAEAALRVSEEQYRFLVDNLRDVIWEMDGELRFTYTSPSVLQMFGYGMDEILGRGVYDVLTPDSQELVRKTVADALPSAAYLDGFHTGSIEVEGVRRGGTTFWAGVSFTLIVSSAGILQKAVGITRDISRRKETETRLKDSLREKELLIKEIHHRVRNNLQIIASLLRLQEQHYTDSYHLGLLHDSQHRIATLSLIYELLCRSERLTAIDFSVCGKKQLAYLCDFYGAGGRGITSGLHGDTVSLDIDTAIPCALILNELVSNSLRHAFPDRRPGRIEVEVTKSETGKMVLLVKDDGVGLPPGLDVGGASSLGLRLVGLLVGQLEGRMELVEYATGAAVQVTFQCAGGGGKTE